MLLYPVSLLLAVDSPEEVPGSLASIRLVLASISDEVALPQNTDILPILEGIEVSDKSQAQKDVYAKYKLTQLL